MKKLLNTLYVTTPDAYLRLEGETVCVIIEKVKKLQVPLHHLNSFVLFDHVMASPALLGKCTKDGMSVVWLDRTGKFRARLEGPVNGNILLRQAQYRLSDNLNENLNLAKRFVAGKIRNSRFLLMRAARETTNEENRASLKFAAKILSRNVSKLAGSENLDVVRGIEGESAKIYFSNLPKVMIASVKGSFEFSERSRRPPKDRFNALISFLYALTLSDCRAALETVGLDPQMGFLHSPRPGRESLALDLLEEFRSPICDRLALTLINRGQIKKQNFDERTGGSVLLNDKGRKIVISAYQCKKQEELSHPFLNKQTPIALLPHIQACLLARYLRKDIQDYTPYLQR